jgi:hypothetical protein
MHEQSVEDFTVQVFGIGMLILVLNDIDNKVRLVPVTMTLEVKQQIESCVVIR